MSDMEYRYTEIPLPSGRTAAIRSRTWPEYARMERDRVERIRSLQEAVKGGTLASVPADSFDYVLRQREALLQCTVKDFDTVASSLSMADIACIEHAVEELERYQVPLGNSAPGFDGS